MTQRVAEYIALHHLLAEGQEVIVALSGGADSVALLLVLRQLGYKVQAAHCNFHLRGEESDRDQHFVEELCHRLGVKLHLTHFDTQAEASATGQSIEMAARTLRYRWFATLPQPTAIAHHRDDCNETMLLNLIRGTGLRGLTGIQPRAEVLGTQVVRPLLCVSRNDILAYLQRQGQPYVTDSTNLECDTRRNVVRLRLMPLLAELNPSIGDTLQANISRLAEAQTLCNDALQHHAAMATLEPTAPDIGSTATQAFSIAVIDASPAPLTLLHYLLTPLGFPAATIEDIFAERHGQSGAIYTNKAGRLLRHCGMFLFRPADTAQESVPNTLPISGKVSINAYRELDICTQTYPCPIIREPETAMLDFDRLVLPLKVRHTRPGDRFCPFGMRGSVLVSDYMTDRHLSIFDKENQLVVTSGDEIVWLVGRRISATAAITPSTRRVMILRLS